MKAQVGLYGFGTLVGFQSYEVGYPVENNNNAPAAQEAPRYRYVYYVLMSEGKDEKTGLYLACTLREIRSETQVLKTLKAGMPVKFRIVVNEYNGRMYERCSDISEVTL